MIIGILQMKSGLLLYQPHVSRSAGELIVQSLRFDSFPSIQQLVDKRGGGGGGGERGDC